MTVDTKPSIEDAWAALSGLFEAAYQEPVYRQAAKALALAVLEAVQAAEQGSSREDFAVDYDSVRARIEALIPERWMLYGTRAKDAVVVVPYTSTDVNTDLLDVEYREV